MGKKKRPTRIKFRRVWRINPKTRVGGAKKAYSRRVTKRELKKILGEESET